MGNYCSGGHMHYTLTMPRKDPLARVKRVRFGNRGGRPHQHAPSSYPLAEGAQKGTAYQLTSQTAFSSCPGTSTSEQYGSTAQRHVWECVKTTWRSNVTYLYSVVKPIEPQALQTHELLTYKFLNWLQQIRVKVCKVRTPTLQKWGYVKFIAQSTL